jgi:hypothetical protein
MRCIVVNTRLKCSPTTHSKPHRVWACIRKRMHGCGQCLYRTVTPIDNHCTVGREVRQSKVRTHNAPIPPTVILDYRVDLILADVAWVDIQTLDRHITVKCHRIRRYTRYTKRLRDSRKLSRVVCVYVCECGCVSGTGNLGGYCFDVGCWVF